MSEADRQRYDSYRMGETGIPLSLGNGIAPTAAVFDTGKVALLNQLRAEQQRIYTEYGNARRKLEADIQGLKATVEQHNKVLETRYGELVQIRAALGKGQSALNNMFNSGTFEHCLGMGLKTSANYTITFDDGRQQQGPPGLFRHEPHTAGAEKTANTARRPHRSGQTARSPQVQDRWHPTGAAG
jgi:hypothetical protein